MSWYCQCHRYSVVINRILENISTSLGGMATDDQIT